MQPALVVYSFVCPHTDNLSHVRTQHSICTSYVQLGHGDTTDAWLPLEVTLHCKNLKLPTSTRSSSIISTASTSSSTSINASSSTLVASTADDTIGGSYSSKQQHNVSCDHRTSDMAHRQHLRQHCAAAVSCGMHHTLVSNSTSK
jgi:hypothetical protein